MNETDRAAAEVLEILTALRGPREAMATLTAVHAAIIGAHRPQPQRVEAMIIDYVAALRIAVALQAKKTN